MKKLLNIKIKTTNNLIKSMISDEYKCIFVHINKCGGTTIDHLFTGKFQGHKKAFDYKKLNPNKFNTYFKFAFVRNPWDRVVSFYHYQIKRGWDFYPFKETIPFDEFVKNWLISMPNQTSLNVNPCYDWISDENDNLIIDFVGKIEKMQEDFDLICKKIGMEKQKLSCKNKSIHKHYTEYYNKETRDIVACRMEKDIKYFGYKFEG